MTAPTGLRIGISLSAHFPPGADPATGLARTLEQVRLAEEVGLDTVLLGHHYLTRSQFLQPVPMVAYLAAQTSRIRLGFGVHLLGLHNPLAAAEEFATLDQLSGGRLILGLGSGYRTVEFRAFGIPPAERYRRFEENVTVLRELLSGRPVTHRGAFGELDGARLLLPTVRPEGPPVWLGAFGPVGVRRAARLDTAWAVPPNGDLAEVTRRMDQWRAALERYGRSPDRDYPLLREGSVAPTSQAAVEAAAPYLAQQYRDYRGWQHGAGGDDLLYTQALLGSPAQVAERLARFAEIGHTDVVLRVSWDGMAHEDVLRSIRLLGEQVRPALAGVPIGPATTALTSPGRTGDSHRHDAPDSSGRTYR